jgi:hypothetical protein
MDVTIGLSSTSVIVYSFFSFQADLEKAINAIRHSAEHFRLYINRFDRWLIENHERAIKIFQTFDTEHTGKVTYGQFKAGMYNVFDVITSEYLYIHVLVTLSTKIKAANACSWCLINGRVQTKVSITSERQVL